MKLMYKQLSKELFKNKPFVISALFLTAVTSFMYFFVHFSVDTNMEKLRTFSFLNENQVLYQNALSSNAFLANSMLAALTGLTSFVFAMFFYRYFKSNSRQLGCLKSLGFQDASLRLCFVAFTAVLWIAGTLPGLGAAYFASDILLLANRQTYMISDLVRGLSAGSVVIGLFLPAMAYCFTVFFTYYLIHGRETALLIAGTNRKVSSGFILHFADRISFHCPVKSRLSIRLALRKPISAFLIFLSVMSFSIMFLMAYSLTLSSQTVLESQTLGHNYLFDTQFDSIQTPSVSNIAAGPDTGTSSDLLHYLDTDGTLLGKDGDIPCTVACLEDNRRVLSLMDKHGAYIASPIPGEIVISTQLQELYGFQQGDRISVSIGNTQRSLTIAAIAFNAKTGWVYINQTDLCQILKLPKASYTGILSMNELSAGGTVTTYDEKLENLEKGAVSNRTSAVINQALGCFVGCILLYLALLLNFQDSTRDILILRIIGYDAKDIRKMLLDIYRPILWAFFVLTLFPGMTIVKSILKSLSIQIGEYLPFQTHALVIIGIFLLLNLIYWVVQSFFHIGIQRILKKEAAADFTG